MAISDKYLPGNLNQAEMDTVKGIPMSIFNNLTNEEKARVLGLSGNLNKTEMDLALENLPISERQRLAEARANASITEQESSVGSFAEIKSLIGRLMAAGASREEITAAIQNLTRGNLNRAEIGELIAAGESGSALMSTAEGQFGGSPHSGGPFWRQYNQGGIVSLRRLTRPIGI